jgi:pimeloyl-ACP methyl ester carboxylesterase
MHRPKIEPLEPRTLLSATPVVSTDGADLFRRATPLGRISGTITVQNALTTAESSDFFSFSVRSSGNVNLHLSSLSANANLRLFDPAGHQLAISARPHARDEWISLTLNKGSYTFSIDRGKRAPDTSYSLTLQADLNYQTVNIAGQDYKLALVRADKTSAPIDPAAETWIVIHGWLGSPKATANVANAIDAASRHIQVLQVDWSSAADDPDAVSVISRVPDVANFVAAKLTDWHIAPANLNLVGHSFGGYMIDQIARRMPTGTVDRLVALDPATLALGSIDFSNTNYAAHSQHSIAFVASDVATLPAAATADTLVKVDIGKWTDFASHIKVRELFAGITQQNNSKDPGPISPLFSLKSLNSSTPFAPNTIDNIYEATLTATASGNTWIPKSLTYTSPTTHRTITLTA